MSLNNKYINHLIWHMLPLRIDYIILFFLGSHVFWKSSRVFLFLSHPDLSFLEIIWSKCLEEYIPTILPTNVLIYLSLCLVYLSQRYNSKEDIYFVDKK